MDDLEAGRLLPRLQRDRVEALPDPHATLVDALFRDPVEPPLIQPTFLTAHPVELSPLAKRSADDPRLVERFETYIGAMEIGNAFSELNDPDDQRSRLEEQLRAHGAGDEEAHPVDEDFLRSL